MHSLEDSQSIELNGGSAAAVLPSSAPPAEKARTAAAGQPEFSARSVGVLAAAATALLLSPIALLTSFTLFMQPMSRDLGWSRTQISFLVTLIGLGGAVVSPLIGKAVDRWGPRRVVLAFSISFGFVVASASLVGDNRWEVYGVFGLLGLLNAGMVPYGRMIAGWFERRRGLAYGLFGFGITILQPLFLQAMRPVIDLVGWRGAYVVFGAIVLVVSVPVVFQWFREPQAQAVDAHRPAGLASGCSAREAWTSRTYWLIVGSLVLSMFVYMGIATHGVAMFTERGLSRVSATNIVAAISIGTMVTQPLIGYLSDRVNSPWVVLPFAGAATIGVLLLHRLTHPAGLIAAAVILGLGVSGEAGTTQYWVTRYFGLRNFSLIYGSIQPMTMLFAVAGGPLLIGAVYDHTGSYALDFRLMEAAQVGAAVLIGLLGPYVYFGGAHSGSGARAARDQVATPGGTDILSSSLVPAKE